MSRKTLKRGFISVSGGIFISRILGYLRDILIAWWIPTRLRDIFFLTLVIPNLSRRVLGEGALSTAFLSLYPKLEEKEGREKALRFAFVLFNYLLISLSLLLLISLWLAPLLIKFFAPGFSFQEKIYATKILRIMLPYSLFICVSAFFSSYLNTCRIYISTTLSFVIFNTTLIIFLCLREHFPDPLIALSIGVLVSGAGQVLIHLPYLRKTGFKLKRIFSHPEIKTFLTYFSPALLGAGIFYVYTAVDKILASFLSPGSISSLYYSNRLIQLPLALTGVALSMVSFPFLSRESAKRDRGAFSHYIGTAMRWLFIINLPITLYLILLGKPIIRFLFERGEFTPLSTAQTLFPLIFYAPGLYFFSSNRLLSNSLYTLEKPWVSLKLGGVSVIFNVILSVILMFPLKQGGLALATTLSAILFHALLVKEIKKIKSWDILGDKKKPYLLVFFFFLLFTILVNHFLKGLEYFKGFLRVFLVITTSATLYFSLLKRLKIIGE